MNLLDLKNKSNTESPKDILAFLKEQNITDYNGYLLFNLVDKMDSFYQNLIFLEDESIWEKAELEQMTLMAQTIDNDYILATESTVLVIPYSLNRQDSEVFHLSFWDFLIQFDDKTLVTTILNL